MRLSQRWFARGIGSIALCLSLSAFAPEEPRAGYSIAEIVFPAGSSDVQPGRLNNRGQVAGVYTNPQGLGRGFIWTNGALVELPPLPGHSYSNAVDVSNDGIAVGRSATAAFGVLDPMAVKWIDGQPQSLGTLGGAGSACTGVSANGIVTGWAMVEPQFTRFHGFVQERGAMRSIGIMLGGSWTEAHDVNDTGQIVGVGMTITSFQQAFFHDPQEGLLNIGTLGGLTSSADAISDDGRVVGTAQTGVQAGQAFEGIVRHAFHWHRGVIQDLGALPGTLESFALDVNTGGTVVGHSNSADGSLQKAFVWRDGSMSDLNALVPPDSGWQLRRATGINEAGVIVGNGLRKGQPAVFILHPVAR